MGGGRLWNGVDGGTTSGGEWTCTLVVTTLRTVDEHSAATPPRRTGCCRRRAREVARGSVGILVGRASSTGSSSSDPADDRHRTRGRVPRIARRARYQVASGRPMRRSGPWRGRVRRRDDRRRRATPRARPRWPVPPAIASTSGTFALASEGRRTEGANCSPVGRRRMPGARRRRRQGEVTRIDGHWSLSEREGWTSTGQESARHHRIIRPHHHRYPCISDHLCQL